MARFFQTAPTQFVEDFIYQPPWQLIQQATAKKQQEYDNMLAQAKLFDNLPIQHLQGEDDVYNIQEKQRYYSEKANQIAQAIKRDPASVNKYLPNIEALSKELQQDYTTGDISKIQGSYNAYQQWQKDNEQLKKDDPSRYSAANAYFLNEYAKDGGNSINKSYKGDLVTKGLDYEALRKSMSELKASSVKSTTTTPAGNLYLVERGGKKEQLTEDELTAWLQAQVVTPENLASLRQSQQFGLGTYTDAEGKIDWKGGSLFTPLRGMASAAAYSNEESEIKYSGDSAAIARMNEDGQNRRWAIDRQDKLNKEYQDRVDAANKTKDEKVSAIDKEIADGWINNDMVKVQFYENAKNNLLGREGTFKSNAGSMFKNFSDLQTKSASGNVDAQKQLSQGLNTFLKKSGIDFKDPRQKALAQDIVGKIKQNKLSIDDLDDYLEKMVPKVTTPLNTSQRDRAVREGERDYKGTITPIQNQIDGLKDKIDSEKRMLKHYDTNKAYNQLGQEVDKYQKKQESLNRIKFLESEIKKKQSQINSIDKNKYINESIKEASGWTRDSNEGFRNTFKSKIENALTNFKDDWETNKSKFTTNYATAPLSISGQSSMKTILRDVNNRKDFVNEDGTEVSATQFNNFDNITSIVPTDGRGRYGLIATDKNGNQTRLLTNPGTPIYNAVYNIAKADVNSNTEVGLAVKYPTIGIIKQRAEALKTAGQSNVRLDITSAKGNDYHIQQIGNTDKFNVYDKYLNPVNTKGPIDYVSAGRMIDGLDNK